MQNVGLGCEKMHPFLKWPGGKRWLVFRHPHIFPNEYNIYYEPFLGGGSVFFHLMPENAFISDTNQELINTYRVMAKNPGRLRVLLEEHQENHCVNHYYDVRDNIPDGALARAARFLYLNRTCFNGMYRVNKDGAFNVPIGTRDYFIDDVDMFEEYARILQNVRIRSQDFVATIREAADGDLVFVDPPYTTSNKQNSYIKYNEKLFSWRDQIRLLNALDKAKNRGAFIIATNVLFPQLQQMYQQRGFYTQTLNRFSSISGKAAGRGSLEELLITSRPVNLI